MLTLLLLACSGSPTQDKTSDDSVASVDDSAALDSRQDTAPLELNGELPEEAFGAPEFTAQNHLGEARGRPDLIGHPTVMWFFPAAGTFG